MLWVYGHYKYFNYYSAMIDFRRQNLCSGYDQPDLVMRQAEPHLHSSGVEYYTCSNKSPKWDEKLFGADCRDKHAAHCTTFMRCSPEVVLMLGQRRRRWPNIKTTSEQCLVFAYGSIHVHSCTMITRGSAHLLAPRAV